MPKKEPKKPVKPEGKSLDKVRDKEASYTAKDIYVLEGLEPVRKRPGMYIGSTGPDGLHHLVWEVVDNSIDEAMAGYCKNITVELLSDNKVSVTDDGRGIPVDLHQQTKKSALETALTTLHAGGKFGGESYKVSGGLHGVGVSVVNALSIWLKAEVERDGGMFVQEYKRGEPQYKLKKTGKSDRRGTKITFQPDPEIFQTTEFDLKRILEHLRQQAYLTKGVRINIFDYRKTSADLRGFYFEGGIMSFVKHLARNEKPLQEEVFYVGREAEKMEVEVAFLYVDDYETKELSFANNIYTPDGGMHLTGFKSALTRSLNTYARAEKYLKENDENLISDDTREGLVSVISIRLREPQFEGQTKARLGNPNARTAVETVVGEALKEFLEKRPHEARRIIEKVLLAARARKAAKAAKETVLRKGAFEGLTLPGKLADCISRSAEESELFIVEGDSAGGCFLGSTKVALTDGRNVAFKDLAEEDGKGKENYCYTVKDDGGVGVALIINPRLTRKKATVIKVILDNDEEIICTPDHKFMLRDGNYKEAQYLTSDDSLAPFYQKLSEIGGQITIRGYEMVYDYQKHFWIFTHLLSDQFNLEHKIYIKENGSHRHHKDFNKLNNNPSNLTRITKEEHSEIHRQHIGKTLHRPEVKEKCAALKRTSAYREKARVKSLEKRELFSKNAKKQWEDQSYKRYMGRKFLEFYNASPEYRQKSAALLANAQKKYWSEKTNKDKAANRVRAYFETHPEKKTELSHIAEQQWDNQELKDWRREKTAKQWTVEFRKKRKEAYNRTYLTRALRTLYGIYKIEGAVDVEKYNHARKDTNDKTLIKYDTILQRFFAGDEKRLQEAVTQYNHRIKKIIPLKKKADVYDLEVPGTHNFALASGVFVHNSAKSGRDRRTQAILPLKGKILNIEKARLDKMLANQEIRSLVVAIGASIGQEFDLTKVRYHKVIVMTDADVDGAHIRTLLLTLFYRHFLPILESGYLYIAQPPLYRIQRGKDIRYAYSEAEKDKVVKEILQVKSSKLKVKSESKESKTEKNLEEQSEEVAAEGGEIKGINIQRYKGLGEMNADQLWETTMNPENRSLKQVTMEDAEATDKLFDILMGSDVAPRKQFIQAHATSVKNLDV